MTIDSKDILNSKALFDLSLEFVNSREKLKRLKLIKKKPLIGTIMPNLDLVWAAGGYPVWPIRMESFGNEKITRALDLGKSLLGSGVFNSIIQSYTKFDKTNFVDSVIHDLINGIFKRYGEAYDIGVENGVPSDECYGIKLICGSMSRKGKNMNAIFLPSVRCSAFEKAYETWGKYSPTILIDVPPYNNEASHELAVQEVYRAAKELSKVTGQEVSNNSLKKAVEITNECKEWYWRFMQIALGDIYPINPVTFGEFQALISIAFQDMFSDPVRFRDLLKAIVLEMERNIRKGINTIDVSKMPKVLFTTRFGGWDHIVEDYLYESGGRVIYADWFIHGYMPKVKTSGDMFDNYATYLQQNALGFGPNNHDLVEEVIKFVDKNNIDAVLYNQLFGCHSLCTSYTRLRKELMKKEIPSTMVSFNNVGENREQLKTRVVALMELL